MSSESTDLGFAEVEMSEFRATIRLNVPEKHNVLTTDNLDTLERYVAGLEERGGIRVLVLTGAGEKTFCSGVDLGDISSYDWTNNPLEKFTDRLEALPFATICALNGGVYGGGSDIALACDFRIGVEGMKCFIPPARLGIHYHVPGLARCVTRLGLGPAKRLFLAGETLQSSELSRIGFLDYCVTREELSERTDALAQELAAMAPLSIAGMKATLNGAANGTLDREAAEARMLACNRSEDFAEGQAARKERRAPEFRGR